MKEKSKIKSNLELSRQIRGIWGINPVTRIHDRDKKDQIRNQRRSSKGLCRQELYARRPNENKTGPSSFLLKSWGTLLKISNLIYVAIY